MKNARAEEFFLREALRLARYGEGWTNPNPMVGAAIVKGGKIIGKGYHTRVGAPHAEIEAFKNAKRNVKGATLYVNLEPCSLQGRTPPCVPAIIAAGIKEVVFCTLDPNKKVHGRGAKALRKGGIRVSVGSLAKEARALNEAFFTLHEKKRPFVALKFAASLDGKMATATGDSKWITNEAARAFSRSLRGKYQAILVGINTVLRDDPHLGARPAVGGARGIRARDPLRIILDSHLRISLDAKVLRDKNVLLATTLRASAKKRAALEKRGIPLHVFKGRRISPRDLLALLTKKEIVSVLVEGGGEVLGSFIDARIVDKVYAFYAPILIGGDSGIGGKGANTVKRALRFKEISTKRFGDNILVVGSAVATRYLT